MLCPNAARPDNFQRRLAADEHLRAFGYTDGQSVVAIRAKFPQAFFFGLQAFVGAVKGDAELVRSGRQEAFQAHGVHGRLVTQAGCQQQVVVRKNRKGAVGDGGVNLDAQGSPLRGNGDGRRHRRRPRQRWNGDVQMSVLSLTDYASHFAIPVLLARSARRAANSFWRRESFRGNRLNRRNRDGLRRRIAEQVFWSLRDG